MTGELDGPRAIEPGLARATAATFGTETATAVSGALAAQFERPAQVWSMRRQSGRRS